MFSVRRINTYRSYAAIDGQWVHTCTHFRRIPVSNELAHRLFPTSIELRVYCTGSKVLILVVLGLVTSIRYGGVVDRAQVEGHGWRRDGLNRQDDGGWLSCCMLGGSGVYII